MEAYANPVRAEEKCCVDYLACHRLVVLKLEDMQWTQGGKTVKQLFRTELSLRWTDCQLWLGAEAVVTSSGVTLFCCWSHSAVMSATTPPHPCKVPRRHCESPRSPGPWAASSPGHQWSEWHQAAPDQGQTGQWDPCLPSHATVVRLLFQWGQGGGVEIPWFEYSSWIFP